MKAIQDEVRYMPQRGYTAGDAGQLARMKAIVAKLPPPKKAAAQKAVSTPLSIPDSRPSGRTQSYQGKDFSLSYPDNWKTFADQGSSGVTIAAPSAMQQSQNGVNVGYGAMVGYYRPKDPSASLWQATDELVAQLRAADPQMRAGREMPREIRVGGKSAIVRTLYAVSVFQGQTEVDRLVAVSHPNGIIYFVFISPDSEGQYANSAFDRMTQSIRFRF